MRRMARPGRCESATAKVIVVTAVCLRNSSAQA